MLLGRKFNERGATLAQSVQRATLKSPTVVSLSPPLDVDIT